MGVCNADTTRIDKINLLIEKYNKETIKSFIRHKTSNTITVQIGNKLYIKHGAQQMEYITAYSVDNDLKRMGISLDNADDELTKWKASYNPHKPFRITIPPKKTSEKHFVPQKQTGPPMDMHLLSWSWKLGRTGRYAEVAGLVKNTSIRTLYRVKAMVTWTDTNGDVSAYDYGYLELTSLAPGQTSPFYLMESYNQNMYNATLQFSSMGKNISFSK